VGARAEDRVTPLAALDTFADAVDFVRENPHLLLDRTVEHLVLSAVSIALAIVLAIPLGVALGHMHRGSFLAINVGNIGRALPSLAIIAIGIAVLGISSTNVVIALVVLAGPPMLTNAYVAVDTVDPDAVESARAMGMSPHQVLRKIELPLALPLIFAGIRTASVYVIATATIAAVAGGRGLGEIIVDQAGYRVRGVVAAALIVSLLAITVDLLFALLQRVVTPRGVRETAPAWEADVTTGVLRVGPVA
jgi:osmoprotectant transport system permease protein